MTWQSPILASFCPIFQLYSTISPWRWLPMWIKFPMVLHVRLRNLHLKLCQNQCALRVVFILKRTVAYVLGHFGAIFGHLKIIRFGWFFYWSTMVTHAFTISNFMTLLFQEVGGLPQKCPKMAVFCSFFGAVHILNRRRALGVAPLTSPLSELATHQMLWKSVRVKGLFWS